MFGSGDDGLPPDVYEGSYASGWEINDFRACNRDASWWVTGDEEARARLRERYAQVVIEKNEGGKMYVRLRGDPSGKGNYGNLGGSEREFELSEVVESRAFEEGDCQ